MQVLTGMKLKHLEQARELAKEHHVEFEERHKKGDILNLFFEEYVEEHLDSAYIYYGSSN